MDIFIIKDELTTNLCTGISPHIVDGFTSIYEDAVRHSPMRVIEQMKRFLIDIQNWNTSTIVNETRRVLGHFPTLRKVLKSINYINIKSLSLMGRHNVVIDDTYISTNTPSVRDFIHRVYMNASKEFFHDVTLMDSSNPGVRPRQILVVQGSIKQVLNESVPLTDLLFNIADDDDEDSMVINSTTNMKKGTIEDNKVSDNETQTTIAETANGSDKEDNEEEENIGDEEDDNDEAEEQSDDSDNEEGENDNATTANATVLTVPLNNGESGIVTNSGTNVQIMLHSTLANEGKEEQEEDDEQDEENGNDEITSQQIEGFEFTTAIDTDGFLGDTDANQHPDQSNNVAEEKPFVESVDPISNAPTKDQVKPKKVTNLQQNAMKPAKSGPGPIRRRPRNTMRS